MTVSRVVNNSGPVAEATRRRVLQAIEELGYKPNMIAQALVRKRTNVLGLVIYDEPGLTRAPFYYDMIFAAENEASAMGYDLLIFSRRDGEDYATRVAHSGVVDGLIIMGGNMVVSDLSRIDSSGLPYCMVGKREFEGVHPSYVYADYVSGFKRATTHLVEIGHRDIGLVGLTSHHEPDEMKLRGYQLGLYEAGLPFNPELVATSGSTQWGGYMGAESVMKQRPTALIVNGTNTTIGATSRLREAGVDIPDSCSLIAFDEFEGLSRQHRDLVQRDYTRLILPKQELGERAVDIVLSLIEGKESSIEQCVELVFVEGETVAARREVPRGEGRHSSRGSQ
jgi:DNA-binding LacI/PurR family transcriptional regulator